MKGLCFFVHRGCQTFASSKKLTSKIAMSKIQLEHTEKAQQSTKAQWQPSFKAYKSHCKTTSKPFNHTTQDHYLLCLLVPKHWSKPALQKEIQRNTPKHSKPPNKLHSSSRTARARELRLLRCGLRALSELPQLRAPEGQRCQGGAEGALGLVYGCGSKPNGYLFCRVPYHLFKRLFEGHRGYGVLTHSHVC